jgi:hypothetical protein
VVSKSLLNEHQIWTATETKCNRYPVCSLGLRMALLSNGPSVSHGNQQSLHWRNSANHS